MCILSLLITILVVIFCIYVSFTLIEYILYLLGIINYFNVSKKIKSKQKEYVDAKNIIENYLAKLGIQLSYSSTWDHHEHLTGRYNHVLYLKFNFDNILIKPIIESDINNKIIMFRKLLNCISDVWGIYYSRNTCYKFIINGETIKNIHNSIFGSVSV